jgi:hypothetical protein
MTRRDWDGVRRAAPLRARGGQEIGYISASRPRRATSLAALSLLLPGLSDDGLERVKSALVRGTHETIERRTEVFSTEVERRRTRSKAVPFSHDRAPFNIVLRTSDADSLPTSDLQALASTLVADDLPTPLLDGVATLRREIEWMVEDRRASPPN